MQEHISSKDVSFCWSPRRAAHHVLRRHVRTMPLELLYLYCLKPVSRTLLQLLLVSVSFADLCRVVVVVTRRTMRGPAPLHLAAMAAQGAAPGAAAPLRAPE